MLFDSEAPAQASEPRRIPIREKTRKNWNGFGLFEEPDGSSENLGRFREASLDSMTAQPTEL